MSPQNLTNLISLTLDESVFFSENALISYCCIDPEAENSHLSFVSESKENFSVHTRSCGCLGDSPVTTPRNIILNRN